MSIFSLTFSLSRDIVIVMTDIEEEIWRAEQEELKAGRLPRSVYLGSLQWTQLMWCIRKRNIGPHIDVEDNIIRIDKMEVFRVNRKDYLKVTV